MTVNDKIVVYRTIYSILNGFNVSHIFDVALKHPYRQKKNVPSFRALFSNDNIFLYRTTDFYLFIFFLLLLHQFYSHKSDGANEIGEKTIKLHCLSERNIQCFMDPPFDLQPIECTISITSSVSK